MTRGEKYAKKSPKMRFFHKYTGSIVLGILITVILLVWVYNESQAVFFEGWQCNDIVTLIGDELTPKENIRLNEIVAECIKEPFTP